MHTWESKGGQTFFVDVMFMIRCPPLAEHHDAIDEITATIGSEYMLHRLFATAQMAFENMVIARSAPEYCDQLSIQGVAVKLHTKNPYENGGEWTDLVELIQRTDPSGDPGDDYIEWQAHHISFHLHPEICAMSSPPR